MGKQSRPPAYRRRTDGNHKEIREALRKEGWYVVDYSGVGHGVPDLLVGRAEKNGSMVLLEPRWWCEIKERGKKLTEAEQEFFNSAPGPKCIAYCAEDALEFGRRLLEAAK